MSSVNKILDAANAAQFHNFFTSSSPEDVLLRQQRPALPAPQASEPPKQVSQPFQTVPELEPGEIRREKTPDFIRKMGPAVIGSSSEGLQGQLKNSMQLKQHLAAPVLSTIKVSVLMRLFKNSVIEFIFKSCLLIKHYKLHVINVLEVRHANIFVLLGD